MREDLRKLGDALAEAVGMIFDIADGTSHGSSERIQIQEFLHAITGCRNVFDHAYDLFSLAEYWHEISSHWWSEDGDRLLDFYEDIQRIHSRGVEINPRDFLSDEALMALDEACKTRRRAEELITERYEQEKSEATGTDKSEVEQLGDVIKSMRVEGDRKAKDRWRYQKKIEKQQELDTFLAIGDLNERVSKSG